VTSSGQLVEVADPPYFVLIEKALRDEGTSYHYLAPSAYAFRRAALDSLADRISTKAGHVIRGGTWTTDAPYRETAEAIAYAKSLKLLAVEMEASALYAFAEAREKNVICFAHVTNRMAVVENDFEKGENSGNTAMIHLLMIIARVWRSEK
jgi:purine-nucleoside phosphorylase